MQMNPSLLDNSLLPNCWSSLTRLRVLHFPWVGPSPDWTQFPFLQKLTAWTSSSIANLTQLSSLHTLHIKLPDDDSLPLCVTALTQLFSLTISHELQSIDLSQLSFLRTLDAKSISDDCLLPSSLQTLAVRTEINNCPEFLKENSFPFLTSLRIPSLTSGFLEIYSSLTILRLSVLSESPPLSLLTNLRSLAFHHFDQNMQDPLDIGLLSNLTHLDANSYPLDLRTMTRLPNLVDLSLGLAEEQVQCVGNFTQLTALRTGIRSYRFRADTSALDFHRLTSLRSLCLNESSFVFDSLLFLTKLTRLECPNANLKAKHISTLTNLRVLMATGPTFRRRTAKMLSLLESVNGEIAPPESRALSCLPLLIPWRCNACRSAFVTRNSCLMCDNLLEICDTCVGSGFSLCSGCFHVNMPFE